MTDANGLVIADAPVTKKIKAGRYMMLIGAGLLLVSVALQMAEFVLSIAFPAVMEVDFTNPMHITHVILIPFICAFLIVVAIGGISYVRGRGPLMQGASIGAIALGVYIVIDLIIEIRNLAHGIGNPEFGTSTVLYKFLSSFLQSQLFCGVFFIGWFLAKDYLD